MKRTMNILMALALVLVLTLVGYQVQAQAADYPSIGLDEVVYVELEGGEQVWFRFVPEESGYYAFSSQGDMDTYGTICDSEESYLAGDDDSGEGLNFDVFYHMEAGETYYVVAELYSSDAAGGFCVTVTEKEIPQIRLDESAWVELEAGEKAWFRFAPRESGVYVFSSQGDVDTYGMVYDGEQNFIESNDDAAEGTNFSIYCYMEAGETYLLEAEMYWGDEAGSFYVTVTESRVADVYVHPTSLNANLDGYLVSDGYYDENDEWVEENTWFHYEPIPETITLYYTDGTSEQLPILEGLEKNGLMLYYWDDQSSDNVWQPGGVYYVQAETGCISLEYEMRILEPVVTALRVEDVTVRQNVDGYEDGDNFVYTYDPSFYVILNDGSRVYSQEGCVQISGKDYYLSWTDDQYDDPWGLGAHEAEGWLGAYETTFIVTVVADGQLAAPEILSCYSKQQTSVKVTWTTVAGADGYEIWRSETPDDMDSWKRIKSITDGDIDRYTNQGLTEGVTYYYKVRAFVLDGDGQRIYSDFSDHDHMPAAVVFDGPYSNATFRIRLRWEEVGGCHGYQIWRQAEDGSWNVVKTLGDRGNVLTNDQGSVTAYSNTGLEAGEDYTYRMRAFYITEDGRKVFGAWSDEITVAVMPEPPVVTASAGAGFARLSWDELNGVEGYQVWMSTSETGGYEIVKSIADGDVTSYTKYDLESGEVYYFKIRAYVEVDGKKTFGSFSETVAVTVR